LRFFNQSFFHLLYSIFLRFLINLKKINKNWSSFSKYDLICKWNKINTKYPNYNIEYKLLACYYTWSEQGTWVEADERGAMTLFSFPKANDIICSISSSFKLGFCYLSMSVIIVSKPLILFSIPSIFISYPFLITIISWFLLNNDGS